MPGNTDRRIEKRGIRLSRVLSGTFMTSLDGPGFSITLLKATTEMLEHIDAPTNALGWPVPTFTPSSWSKSESRVVQDFNESTEEKVATGNLKCKSRFVYIQSQLLYPPFNSELLSRS